MASTDREPIEQLAEAWRERWRRGEQFSADEYIARRPELADAIRELFPAIALTEQLKPPAADLTGAATVAPGVKPQTSERPERLGDFRIVREIGRGRMGVVYEAEQESLGRRVALKVLPAGVAQRASYLERFRREARAAAKLHHTNIVPVFGVGEENGTCYYAMQYIQGQPLDDVLDEVKRLRGEKRNAASGGITCGAAQGLLADRFPDGDPIGPGGRAPEPVAMPSAPRTEISGQTGGGYYRRIALLGVQAAEGLAHAHGQGILHRDIKPSNLLLDLHGTLWITDFGLAKAEDSSDLTEAGDIIGTVRYMAPERFEGKADARSDIYAIGLTLYELLALRPPFDATDRAGLIGQITADGPTPLRALVPEVPRDLETIVAKAMAREPAARYASGADLADDLHRFLENRLIKARRAPLPERFRRWCRRNPVVAGLTVTVFLLLAFGAVGSTMAAFWLQAERDAARDAEGRALQESDRARREEDAKTEKLYESYAAQARASRFSRRPGQRFATLNAIKKAVQIARDRKMPAEKVGELRNLAVACLALPDWRTVHEWKESWADGWNADWDDRHDRYARGHLDGHVSVRRLRDNGEIGRVDFVPGESWVHFSPDGRFLYAYGKGQSRMWDLARDGWPVVLDQRPAYSNEGQPFHPDGRHFLFIRPVQGAAPPITELVEADLLDPQKPPRVVTELPAGSVGEVGIDATGKRVAVVVQGTVHLHDAQTGRPLPAPPEPHHVDALAWHPRGKFLALVCLPRSIHVWDVTRSQQVAAMGGCRSGGIEVCFSADGELLVSTGWEGKVRLWNWRTGQQVLSAPGTCARHFSPDGRLFVNELHRHELVHVAASTEYRSLDRQFNVSTDLEYLGGAMHPAGRLFAGSTGNGVYLWDLQTGDEVAHVHMPTSVNTTFAGAGGLLTNSREGLLYWPIARTSGPATEYRVGPPQHWHTGHWSVLASSKDAQVVAYVQGLLGPTLLLHRERLETPIALGPQWDARHVSVSPDGAWVATGTFSTRAPEDCVVKVWRADTGRFIKQFATGARAGSAFSPDGQWLQVYGGDARIMVRTATWEPAWTAQGHVDHPVFSPDSRLQAAESGEGVIRLHEAATGREKVCLENPNQERARSLRFTPDGTRLVVVSHDSRVVHVWDLSLIRKQLAALDLDWDDPPYPPAPPAPAESIRVNVIGAEMVGNPLAMIQYELQTYSLALLANPLDADSYCQRGRLYLQMKELPRALNELNVAVVLVPGHTRARVLRGMVLTLQGRWSQARDDFNWLLERSADDPDLYRRRAETRMALEDDVGAAADYAEWLKHGDLDAGTLNAVAWRLVGRPAEREAAQLGAADLALPLMEKAVQQVPADRSIVLTLGVTYYRLGRYLDAIEALERFTKQPGGQLRAFELYFLAMCHHRLGDKATAKREFDDAGRWLARAKLTPAQVEDLKSMRAEAEMVLGLSRKDG
jgi:serine/threonine protein kinase/WD40 repeat protein/tetratricopeptide (TPR) repeat protein